MGDQALRVYDSILGLLSGADNPTPLVRLNRVTPFRHTVVYAKLEWYNPFGAVKDRVAANLVDDGEAVGALDDLQRLPDRLFQAAAVLQGCDQMRQHFAVGIRTEGDTLVRQPVPQLRGVLDDPVVNDRDLTSAVGMGMGVVVRRASVGRPSRVAYAHPAVRHAA